MPISAQIFDLTQLAAQTGGDSTLQSEILALFVRQSAEILDLLTDRTTPPQTRADLAHKLKGSARAVGAFALADVAERVETQLRSDPVVDPALADLLNAFHVTHATIEQHLRAQGDH